MKKIYQYIAIAFLASAPFFGASAQNTLYVLHAKGQVFRAGGGAAIKSGDKIEESEKLSFKSTDAALAVMSPEKGRFALQAGKQSENTSYSVKDLIQSFVNTQGGVAQASTKTGKITNKLALQQYFSGKNFLLIDEHKVWISPDLYPVNDERFFYVRFVHKGESVNKKLPNTDNNLVFRRSELLTVFDKTIDTAQLDSVKLFYYNLKEKTSEELAMFTIAVPDKGNLKNEISMLCQILADENKQQKEITAYLTQTYGSIDEEDLNGLGL